MTTYEPMCLRELAELIFTEAVSGAMADSENGSIPEYRIQNMAETARLAAEALIEQFGGAESAEAPADPATATLDGSWRYQDPPLPEQPLQFAGFAEVDLGAERVKLPVMMTLPLIVSDKNGVVTVHQGYRLPLDSDPKPTPEVPESLKPE